MDGENISNEKENPCRVHWYHLMAATQVAMNLLFLFCINNGAKQISLDVGFMLFYSNWLRFALNTIFLICEIKMLMLIEIDDGAEPNLVKELEWVRR